jgi:hypothetical protein
MRSNLARSLLVLNVADTVYSRLLARALEIEGSSQSLAEILRVPEATMLRWRSGRAFMPVQAFQKLMAYIAAAEQRGTAAASSTEAQADGMAERIKFPIGKLFARCTRCDGIEFRRADLAAPLRMTSKLVCCTCAMEVIHGNLLAQLAEDVITHKRAEVVARARRRAALAARRSTDQPLKRNNDIE